MRDVPRPGPCSAMLGASKNIWEEREEDPAINPSSVGEGGRHARRRGTCGSHGTRTTVGQLRAHAPKPGDGAGSASLVLVRRPCVWVNLQMGMGWSRAWYLTVWIMEPHGTGQYYHIYVLGTNQTHPKSIENDHCIFYAPKSIEDFFFSAHTSKLEFLAYLAWQ